MPSSLPVPTNKDAPGDRNAATGEFKAGRSGFRWTRGRRSAQGILLLVVCLVELACPSSPGAETNELAATNRFVAFAERAYTEGLQRWRKNSNSVELCWQFGRVCFDWAEYATNGAQRATLAEQGIAACRHAIGLDAKSAPAHYYLGLNIGQLARTKMFTALYLINQLEKSLKDSVALDPAFDFAGAHRALGMLYRDAPGWTIGSRTKARRHLDKAVELFPDYPGNRLTLLESWLEWGEKKSVQDQIAAVEQMLKKARTQFIGETWAGSWDEWEHRWKAIKAKVDSPRD